MWILWGSSQQLSRGTFSFTKTNIENNIVKAPKAIFRNGCGNLLGYIMFYAENMKVGSLLSI